MQAATYARYSSEGQRIESIEAQLKAINEYAAKKGYAIVEEFIDKAQTGKTDNRPGFQSLIAAAKTGRFQYVLVHKINRFGRNYQEGNYYSYRLAKSGVEVVSVSEDYGDGPHAVLLRSVMMGIAEYESVNIGREALKGLMINADKCKYNGGYILYGYSVDDKQNYIINEPEAEVVRSIYDAVRNGKTYGEIIKSLNSKGIKRRGKPWRANSINDLLRNEKYSGVYTFNRAQQGYTRLKYSPDMIRIPGGMPQIIPTHEWQEVQDVMNNRRRKPPEGNQAKRVYLLTGLMTCAGCGSPYVGSNKIVRGKDYPNYICSGRKRDRQSCSNKDVVKATVEELVLAKIGEIMQNINPAELAKSYNQHVDAMMQDSQAERQAAEQQLKELQRKADNLMSAIETGGQLKIITDRLQEVEREKLYIERQLNRMNKEANAWYLSVPDVADAVSRLNPADMVDADDEVIADALKRIVLSVIVQNGQPLSVTTRFCKCSGWGLEPASRYISPSATMAAFRQLLQV